MRIVLIGFKAGFARSLARYLSGDARVAVTGIAADLAVAGDMLAATRPTHALLEWSALGRSPPGSVRAMRSGRPALRLVAVVEDAAAYRASALEAGADAVISKNAFAEDLEPLLRGWGNEYCKKGNGQDE